MANDFSGILIIWIMLTIFEIAFFSIFGLITNANYQNGVGFTGDENNMTATTYSFNSSSAGTSITPTSFSFIGYIHYVSQIDGIGGWIALFAILVGVYIAVTAGLIIKIFTPM